MAKEFLRSIFISVLAVCGHHLGMVSVRLVAYWAAVDPDYCVRFEPEAFGAGDFSFAVEIASDLSAG